MDIEMPYNLDAFHPHHKTSHIKSRNLRSHITRAPRQESTQKTNEDTSLIERIKIVSKKRLSKQVMALVTTKTFFGTWSPTHS